MGLAGLTLRGRQIGWPVLCGWRGLIAYTALLGLIPAALYMIFLFAPPDQVQRDIYRILYGHVSVAWLAFLAFGIVVIGSIMHLWRRDSRWDSAAVAAAEIGVLFTTLTLATGTIWGRNVWGVWWTWDPRLTTTLVLWFIYVAYLVLRMYIDDVNLRRRVAAIFGIFGFVDVPIVWFSVQWWRSLHPVQTITDGEGLSPKMLATMLVTLAAFTVLFFVVLRQRYLLERASEESEDLHAMVRNRFDDEQQAAAPSATGAKT